jgi:RHS repeat-associated protein
MPSPPETLLCYFRYDPLDRLVVHSPADAPQFQRFYCKNQLTTEIQGAVQHSIVQHGDLLMAQQQRQSEALDTTLLATDQQRSVLHTLKMNHPRRSFTYSPYGHRHTESGLLSLLGFNGERPDPVTGHYFLGNGYRAFNPVLMRFNSPDSLSPFGEGGLNAYAYCLGDPVNQADPTGHVISMRWAFVRDNLKRIVHQPRPIPRTGTNGTMVLYETPAFPALSRPTAKVARMKSLPPSLSDVPTSNISNALPRRAVTSSDEFSRFLSADFRPSQPFEHPSPAMRVAMRNAAEPRLPTGIIPRVIGDAGRLREMRGYANMRGIGITTFPRATQLESQPSRMFEIRRRYDQAMEGAVLRENRPR